MSEPTLSPLTLSLFGPFEVKVNGAPLPRLRSRKGHWLLALLTLRFGCEVERAWLAGTLWPDSSEPQAMHSLRVCLADLRQALGPEAGRLHAPTPHTLSLNLAGVEADVVAFDAAIARGDLPSIEQAVELYRGPLLEGCEEEWAFQERQSREQAYLTALETLAARALAEGEPGTAERHLGRAVAVDPLRETAQRSRMQALAAGGNYAAAILAYRELRLHLHRELNAEPDPETKALFQQIRVDARRRSSERPQPPAREPSTPAPGPAADGLPARDGAELEIAHVLYMDIVGYSRLPMPQQPRLLQELQALIRDTEEFRRAEASHELICLPTGDGMALVFFRDPVAPIQCAMQVGRALRGRPHLPLRMGLHTGPVYRVEDINANANVSGGGINLAQRVVGCGDAGHVLLSGVVRDLLGQVGDWPVHDLGEHEVKHGERLHLFNLYTDEFGNPSLPAQLAAPMTPARSAGASAPASAERLVPSRGSTDRSERGRVALLYKRHAQPDEQVLELLEARLAAHGFQVFVDRHLAVGVEWAREIERQIRLADAVIPLLSAAAIPSEMLAYELQIAHEAAQQQRGKPRLLPIRVRDPGPLPEALAAILDPLQHALWEGPQDNERLVAELLRALERPAPPPAAAPRAKLEAVGGAVPLDSRFYVVRPTDEQFEAAIARQDSIVLVKGARQMGKTSLLARGLRQARAAGARVVRTDFQKLVAADLESLDTLFLTLATSLADQLDLPVLPEEAWNVRRSPTVKLERYLQREVLGRIEAPIVWGLDEVDRLFSCAFGSEVFGLFRSWHNERAFDTEGSWSRLTLAIAYATEAHLFITDINQSPFNVGTRLTLQDFALEQVADLNGRYGAPLRDDAEVARFYRLVNGQPYLVRRGLNEMVSHGLEIGGLEAQADQNEGIFGDHLRRMLVLLARDPDLCEAVRGVLRGGPCTTAESFYRLRSAGVLAGDSAADARPRCQLYAAYLARHLR
jgi:DNA-binding SARP family transcriptional activator